MKPGKVIVVCGLIGAGKSVLSRELSTALGEETLHLSEPDEKNNRNPYLADYYKDPARWALTMQLHLLGLRYQMHLHAQWHALNTGHNAVMDSSYWQDTCFARLQLTLGLISEREFNTYAALYYAMTASVLLPNVCLRVLVSSETAARRVKHRMERETGRQCESGIALDYLEGLDRAIDHMVSVLRAQGVTVLDVPWDCDRDSELQREMTVKSLAARILALEPPDFFLDLHRRTL